MRMLSLLVFSLGVLSSIVTVSTGWDPFLKFIRGFHPWPFH